MKKRVKLALLLLPLVLVCFLSVGQYVSAEVAGNTNVEANAQYIFNNYLRAFQVNITEDATITKVSFYTTTTADVNCSASLYYGNYVSPANLIETAFALSVIDGWMNFTFNELVDAGSYWVAIGTVNNNEVNGVRNGDLTGLAGYCSYTWANFPNPFGSYSGENYVWSMFITYTPYVEPTPSPSPSPTPVNADLEGYLTALFFGSVWYFGFLIFMAVAFVVLKIWKFSGAIIVPILIIFEIQYYNRLSTNPELSWAMLFCGFLVLTIAGYTIHTLGNRSKE